SLCFPHGVLSHLSSGNKESLASKSAGTAHATADVQAQQTAMTFVIWTNSGRAAMVGHHDRQGPRDDGASKSWNASHPSRGTGDDCSQGPCVVRVAMGCSIASPSTKALSQNNLSNFVYPVTFYTLGNIV